MIDFSELSIQRICVHTIHPKERGKDCADAQYDEVLADITPEVEITLKTRLAKAFAQKAKSFQLEIYDIREGSFFALSKDLRRLEEPAFISRTQNIAKQLADSQKSALIPGGYFIVIDAVDDRARPVIIVIKAELHEAIRRGEGSCLELVTDIFLSKGDKLFKIAALFKRDEEDTNKIAPNDEWECWLYDEQFRPGNKPSEYFWRAFLGLTIDFNAAIQTALFYEAVVSFIKRSDMDFEKQHSCQKALDVLMINTTFEVIDPNEVKGMLFEEDYQADFSEQVQEDFAHPFIKDTSIIEKKMANDKIHFQNGVSITGSKQDVDRVTFIRSREALSRLTLTDNATILVIPGKPSKKKQ